MRNFIRHPSDIPLEFRREDLGARATNHLNNIGEGGLSFCSPAALQIDEIIVLRIAVTRPAFEVRGRVKWCRPHRGHYEIGIEFLNVNDVFRVRMIEQICHIEHYKNEVRTREGRVLNGEQAAMEWIARYAAEFPELVSASGKDT